MSTSTPGTPVADLLWPRLEQALFAVPSADDLFNPYRDHHPALDGPDAPARRQANLRAYLSAYPTVPPVLLVAEAPGPWGCRFSGVPLTSEAQLVDPAFPLAGTPTSQRAEPHTEYSARIFWRTVRPYWPRFFIWNCVPFHPHKPGAPLTIRTPRTREVRSWEPLLTAIADALTPTLILAIGRKAEGSLRRAGLACHYVRHPSQGGAKQFASGITRHFEALSASI
ncbi:MAG: uracil-DNA glycosylase [Bacteroidota bacterium]